MSALPDNSSHTGSSACDVCATIEARAAMSPGPYATALAAARRTSIITTNTFMFQPVAKVSATSSYFAVPRLTSTSPVQGPDQIRLWQTEELVVLRPNQVLPSAGKRMVESFDQKT